MAARKRRKEDAHVVFGKMHISNMLRPGNTFGGLCTSISAFEGSRRSRKPALLQVRGVLWDPCTPKYPESVASISKWNRDDARCRRRMPLDLLED